MAPPVQSCHCKMRHMAHAARVAQPTIKSLLNPAFIEAGAITRGTRFILSAYGQALKLNLCMCCNIHRLKLSFQPYLSFDGHISYAPMIGCCVCPWAHTFME